MIVCLGFSAFLVERGTFFYLGLSIATLHAAWQFRTVCRRDIATRAGLVFISNQWLGLIVTFALLLSTP